MKRRMLRGKSERTELFAWKIVIMYQCLRDNECGSHLFSNIE